jgi:hypothetical protein
VVTAAVVNVNALALHRAVAAGQPKGRPYRVVFFVEHRKVGVLQTSARSRRDAVEHAQVIADHTRMYRGLKLTYLVSGVAVAS